MTTRPLLPNVGGKEKSKIIFVIYFLLTKKWKLVHRTNVVKKFSKQQYILADILWYSHLFANYS